MQCRNVLFALVVAVAMAPISSMAQQPAPKQAPPAATDKVVAVVNGQNILDSEVTQTIQRQLRGRTLSYQQEKQLREQVLQMLINTRLVEQFLAAKKIQADPKAVDEALKQIKERVGASGFSFDEALKRQGLTEATLKQRLAGELAFQKYADSAVTDRDVTDYFNANKADLGGDEVRASHILIKFPENATDADRQAALAKIKGIRQEITKGLDFGEAAKKYSDCPSSKSGGDLGFFPRYGRMVEPFAETAFTLPKGEVSQPVQTQFGWHLITVTDKKQGDKTLDDVRGDIKDLLVARLFEKTADEQRKTAKIEIPK